MHLKDRIEDSTLSRRQVGIIAICTALYMIDGFDVLLMAFSANAVMEALVRRLGLPLMVKGDQPCS